MDRKNLQRRHRLAVGLLESFGLSHIRLTPLGRNQYHYQGWNMPKADGNGGPTQIGARDYPATIAFLALHLLAGRAKNWVQGDHLKPEH
jgi:hypothetical protein